MITAEIALKKIQTAGSNEDLLQDALWLAGFNFHHFLHKERFGILETLVAMASKQSNQTLFWMVVYLRSAYFSVMEDDEKGLYLGLLHNLAQRQNSFLLAETFELTGRLFRVAPDSVRHSMLRILFDNASRGNAQAICSFCEACERICLELDNPQIELLLAKLEELRQQKHMYHVTETIEHAISKLRNIEVL